MTSILIDKGKVCHKVNRATGMFMGVSSDALLAKQRSTDFTSRRQLEEYRDRERKRMRGRHWGEEGRIHH